MGQPRPQLGKVKRVQWAGKEGREDARCAPATHSEYCLACEGSALAATCAAAPERCRAKAAARKGAERKRAVQECVGPSLK